MNRLMTTEAACALRGFVEHVGSGRRESFRTTADLLAFLESQQPQQTSDRGEKKEEG